MNSQVEKNIDYFLDRVLETQEGFIKKLNKLVGEFDSLKFEIASKYHVMADGDTLSLNARLQESLLNRIEFLSTDYNNRINLLQKEHRSMMEEHKKVRVKWEGKEESFSTHYEEVKKKIFQERKSCFKKMEANCTEIQQKAKELLDKLKFLFSVEEQEQPNIKVQKQFLEKLEKEDAIQWLQSFMMVEEFGK